MCGCGNGQRQRRVRRSWPGTPRAVSAAPNPTRSSTVRYRSVTRKRPPPQRRRLRLDIAGIADYDPTELDVVQGPPAAAGLLLGSLIERLPQPPIDRRASCGIVGGSRHAGQALVEVDEGGHVRVTGPRDSRWTLASSGMWRTSCDSELASSRVEGDRTDQPVGREGIVNGEPRDFAGIGRELAHRATLGGHRFRAQHGPASAARKRPSAQKAGSGRCLCVSGRHTARRASTCSRRSATSLQRTNARTKTRET